mmetsp:Transcript_11506/g.22032  ORF Transcript_11506/g.22032 Transcript_11506/m.22032 type:complete len:99 (+) Transcript_11506:1066-1362(+)|eukprot:scaffold5588_cov180-Amphora_coffeaeformis.AAC.6
MLYVKDNNHSLCIANTNCRTTAGRTMTKLSEQKLSERTSGGHNVLSHSTTTGAPDSTTAGVPIPPTSNKELPRVVVFTLDGLGRDGRGICCDMILALN